MRAARRPARRPRSRTTGPSPRSSRYPRRRSIPRRRTPLIPARPTSAAERGRRHHSELHDAVLLERDQRRPDRDPAGVVPRAVDRVEDPATRAGACSALLLSEDRVVGALLREDPAELDPVARSASVTGVRSGLISTASPERKRGSEIASAASASRRASSRSGLTRPTLALLPAGDAERRPARLMATGADHVIAGVPTCAAFSPEESVPVLARSLADFIGARVTAPWRTEAERAGRPSRPDQWQEALLPPPEQAALPQQSAAACPPAPPRAYRPSHVSRGP